ncbi:hypothetical protein PSJE_11445 [Pseudomonas jessenii]|nr:hypothetical protein PSJE_11445 [Pseudomonas jessenii]
MARFRTGHKTCGSELARDEGVSADTNVECNTAIASKLAPTGLFGVRPQALLGIPYLRNRWAIAVWEVCSRVASCRVEG